MDVILHLTHDCQLNCVYCYGGRRREGRMSWDTAERALGLFLAQPWPQRRPMPQLGFFGGEPLLEWDLLVRCVEHVESTLSASGRTCRFALTTNGLALTAERAAWLAAERFETVLSFDGVREAQDAARPRRDGSSSFDDTCRALDVLADSTGNPGVCAVVSPENVEHLPASVDFFLDRGVCRLMLNPNFFARWDERGLGFWRAGYEHAAAKFEASYRRGVALNVNLFTAKIVTRLRGRYEPDDCCLFGQKEIAVAPSGRIFPCQRMVGEDRGDLGLMGDVFRGFDPQAERALSACRAVRAPECAACDIRRRCRNWCSCVNHALTGCFDSPGGLVCFHERMVVELADRAASHLYAEKNPAFLDTFYLGKSFAPEWV